MSNRPMARDLRAQIRRAGASLLVAAGLVAGVTVVSTDAVSATPAPSPAGPSMPMSSVVGLKKGATGTAVRQLQEALVRVGVGVVGGVDGYFGSATQASVKAWQAHKGLTVTGVVDAATATSLGFTAPAAPAAAPSGASSSGAPEKGSRGRAVAELQLALINSGFVPTGGVDGIFGPATEGVIKRYQQAKGLAVTGLADQATMKALGLGAGAASSGGSSSAPPAPEAPANGALARGARGATVAELQRALMGRGISVAGGADGIFGPATQAAVKSFQRSKGLDQSGSVDEATSSALGLGGAPPAPAPAPPASSSSPYVGLKLGSRGAAVSAVQKAIMDLGWTVRGGADGIYGNATQSVVMLFQKSNGIAASGTIDARTAQILGLNGASSSTPSSGGTAQGYAAYDERGSRVVKLQQALIAARIPLRGGADGVFGSGTAGAIMAFQRAKGLSVTGKVDAATASALGLSASSAPAPPPAASSVRLEAKPVQGPCYYGDTWGFTRGGGRAHLGVDILAAQGKELYAVATGRITQIYVDKPGSLSGNGLKITRPDGTYFFYAHLSALAPGIAVGTPVTAGQVVGYVGSTGNSATPHLHLEVHPGGGSAVNPYPIVKATGAC